MKNAALLAEAEIILGLIIRHNPGHGRSARIPNVPQASRSGFLGKTRSSETKTEQVRKEYAANHGQ
jgi:hypothetical protein